MSMTQPTAERAPDDTLLDRLRHDPSLFMAIEDRPFLLAPILHRYE